MDKVGDRIDDLESVSETKSIGVDYVSKWSSSQSNAANGNTNHHVDDLEESDAQSLSEFTGDELPIFADEECKRLYKLTKEAERERDKASSCVKENRERIAIMHEHLQNVRQEIDHTNALVAAKNKEIDTEKHLRALGERELAGLITDIKAMDSKIVDAKERLRLIQNQIHIFTDEREKLKMDLNWNQEELEQWATSAAKKEGDSLAIQKYTRSDDVVIKELMLKLENLTKRSVEKKTQLENEITETQSKQLEVDRLAKSFKTLHEERRLLIGQWQQTVDVMKDRDREINELSIKYSDLQQIQNDQLVQLSGKKEGLGMVKAENELLLQDNEAAERAVQNKRQERQAVLVNLQTFQDEMDSLKLENIASSSSLEQLKTTLEVCETECMQKTKQLEMFRFRYEEIKSSLLEQEKSIHSREKYTQDTEDSLKEKEKELHQKEITIQNLKQKMFRDSQVVAQLRQVESSLISEISSLQATAKNLQTKLKQLEKERSRQNELLYNAEFKLQEMERKVARGLGERSGEEKKLLLKQIEELEKDHKEHKDKQNILIQQSKKLQLELQRWKKKKELCSYTHNELKESIANVELEITACELNLKKLTAKNDEEMVSHDLVRLEVRRLRDLLRKKLEQVTALKIERENLMDHMDEEKASLKLNTEVQVAQLRAYQDERHKSAIELGQRRIAAEKIQLKHEALMKAHGRNDCDEEEHSPVYHLITAAQRRAELQRKGDILDAEIQERSKELNTMEMTLRHLRERNTLFRSSFTKLDKKGGDYKQIVTLDDDVKSSEKMLLEAKKAMQISKRQFDRNMKDKERYTKTLDMLSKEKFSLQEKTSEVTMELQQLETDVHKYERDIKQQCIAHRKRDYPNFQLKTNEKSLQEVLFQAEIDENHCAQVIATLIQIGREFPETKYSIIESFSKEKIDMEF